MKCISEYWVLYIICVQCFSLLIVTYLFFNMTSITFLAVCNIYCIINGNLLDGCLICYQNLTVILTQISNADKVNILHIK